MAPRLTSQGEHFGQLPSLRRRGVISLLKSIPPPAPWASLFLEIVFCMVLRVYSLLSIGDSRQVAQ